MQIELIKSISKYKDFIKLLYKDDAHFKNNKSGILPIVCGKNKPFYKNSVQKMIAIKENGKTLCQAVFIKHKNSDELSVAFFDSLPDVDSAVELLLKEAENFAAENRAGKIVIGVEGHCNNGLGIPVKNSSYPGFGDSFGKDYYDGYFNTFTKVKLVSYCDKFENVKNRIRKDLEFLNGRLEDISFVQADFKKHFKLSLKRYTDLNNKIFASHRYYFERTYEEDFHLFITMNPLLKNENLIFAQKDGKDIGFLLWYPDYNQLVLQGKSAGVMTFIKYKLLNQYPKTMKVVEFGLLNEYKNTGIILKLISIAANIGIKKYPKTEKIITSWILDENNASRNLTKRYACNLYKESYVYEKII